MKHSPRSRLRLLMLALVLLIGTPALTRAEVMLAGEAPVTRIEFGRGSRQVPRAEYHPGRIIVRFRAGTGVLERADVLREERLLPAGSLTLIGAQLVRVVGRPVEEAVRAWARGPRWSTPRWISGVSPVDTPQ